MLKRRGPTIEPYGTPIGKSMKLLIRVIDFSSVFSVCEVTVHNFKGFIRETVCSNLAVRKSWTM